MKAQLRLETTLDDVLAPIWDRISEKLKGLYGEAVHRSWLAPMRYAGHDNGKIQLSVPTRFMREWVSTHYADDIRQFWHEEKEAEGLSVEFVVAAPSQNVSAVPQPAALASRPVGAPAAANSSWPMPEAQDAIFVRTDVGYVGSLIVHTEAEVPERVRQV
ncbi:MAG: DnaA N-terminal domain-containing protein [Bacteroidota bacterium]